MAYDAPEEARATYYSGAPVRASTVRIEAGTEGADRCRAPAGVQAKDKAPAKHPRSPVRSRSRTYGPGRLGGHSDGHYYSRGRAATPPSTRTTTLKLE